MRILRLQSHIWVVLSAWVSRIISAGSQLLCIRLLIDGLELERYAVFAVLVSLNGWFVLGDFGIGISVQNFISEKRALTLRYHEWALTGIAMVFSISVMLSLALYMNSGWLSEILLREYTFLSSEEKRMMFFCVAIVLVFTNVVNIVYKYWYAEHKGYWANIAPAIASIMGLILIYQVSRLSFGYFDKLYYMILAFLTPNLLVGMGCLYFWMKKATSCYKMKLSIVKCIVSRAQGFSFFALMAACVLQIDYLIMSQKLFARDIVVYNIATKIFGLVFFVYNAVLLALWPVCAEHLTKGHWTNVTTMIKKYIKLGSAFVSVATLILMFSMPVILPYLSPHQAIDIPVPFMLLLGAYFIIRVWTDTFAMMLQSVNYLKPFWILVPAQAVLSVVFQWFLSDLFGYYGIVWGLIGAYLLTVFWGLPLAAHSYSKRNYAEM